MIWDAVKYGHNVLWAVTVAGIPVVWIERATGKTLPSGYTAEDAALVIDSSGDVGIEHVDRQRGVAVAMPLKFKLLDTDTTRSWIRRWSKLMTLTADLDAADTAATVDDSTGWANGDAAWLGLERVTIGTVVSATSLTGITRATAGSMAYQHRAGTTAQVVTDRPRFWRGRDVVLWAVPVDPSGFVPGATLLADAVQVWRGRIESGPVREVDGFGFEAADFGRILDQGLLGSVTGRVVDTSTKYQVASGWPAHIHLAAHNAAGLTLWEYNLMLTPFDDDSDGDLLAPGDIRDRIASAWTDAVSAASATADIGSLKWSLEKGYQKARVQIRINALIVKVSRHTYLDGNEVWFEESDPQWFAGMTADAWIPIGWQSAGNPLMPYSALEGPKGSGSLTVQLDEGAIADVPSAGSIRVQAGNQVGVYAFSGVGSSGNDLYLADVKPTGSAKLDLITGNAATGAAVELLLTACGTLTGLMLECLESSGTAAMRGAADVLVRGQGYSIDDDQIDLLSFANASAPVSSLACEINCAGATFVEIFGGALGLFRAAVVCRPDANATGSPQRLALISTAPFGAGWASTITDDDLLSHEGDPLVSVDRSDSPNVITVSRPVGITSDDSDRLTLSDHPSVESQGRREVDYRIPAASRDVLWPVAKAAAASHLAADQTLQVLAIHVAPWVRGEVGDVVGVHLTHPAIWTWASNPGSTGYSGPARIVGRTINPATLRTQLVLLIDGALTIRALSPAMAVSAFQHATTPTWIEVPLKYLAHVQAALAAAAGPIWLYHYKPGAVETVGERHQISAAASVGGVCRLTVAANPTAHTLSVGERSTLTLPTSTGGHVTSWQESFAHVDDGTQWG